MVWYWYCQDCGEVFPRDDLKFIRHEEYHFWLDDQPAEVMYSVYCPFCGSELIDEAEYCDGCGEPCNPKDLTDGICAICREVFDLANEIYGKDFYRYEEEEEKRTAMHGGA